jgi:hypothetical protein
MASCPRWLAASLAALALWLGSTESASAQAMPAPVPVSIGQYYYYPYYYFPHNYWPTNGPKWPEQAGEPYMRPPAYMAYPPFREPHWRYDLWERRSYYRGFHFWLDKF